MTCDTVHAAFSRIFRGQWGIVSLPGGQQQVLDRIEADIEGCEPRLTSMFAIFARLTGDDGAPRTEALCPRSVTPRRIRAIIAVPIVLGLLTLLVLMAISSSAARSCQSAAGVHGVARTMTCQSAQSPLNRP